MSFSALGLLIASRAKTIEAASGLMNLVMMPMWILSGVFFSAQRFPDLMQPVIKALPLTALINALAREHAARCGIGASWLGSDRPRSLAGGLLRTGVAVVPLEVKTAVGFTDGRRCLRLLSLW